MINLLHQDIKENRKLNRRFRQLSIFFVVILLLALSTWGSLLYAKNILLSKSQSLDDQIATTGSSLLKYRDLEKKVSQSNSRLDQIAGLQSARQPWSKTLTDLANNTPADIQINNLTVGLSPDGLNYQFTLSATAKTLEEIETYRKTLDASGAFSGTTFQSATFNADSSVFTFNLTTGLIRK